MAIKGSCYCGATQFTVVKRPETFTRGTYPFCTKGGALWAYQHKEDDFALAAARDRVLTYRWGSYLIEHHPCDWRLRHMVPLAALGSAGETTDFRCFQGPGECLAA